MFIFKQNLKYYFISLIVVVSFVSCSSEEVSTGIPFVSDELLGNTKAKAVDLGLSVKWASMNVGADSPEDYGDYFAWGETKSKSTYSWENYKYCNGSYEGITKYCIDSSCGTVDSKCILEFSDDAAHTNWGGDWRMPTDEEWTELRTKCTWTWTVRNNKLGCKVLASNGNSIFLPAAGYCDMALLCMDKTGAYYSRTIDSTYSNDAYCVYFNSSNVNRGYNSRHNGLSIRPVLSKK